MRRLTTWGPLAGLVLSCAHGEAPRVSDADFGRLSPAQTRPVDEARRDEQSAREELARAKLGVQEAHHELAMAKADQAAADADAQRADAAAGIASDSREPSALQRAARLRDIARMRRGLADAHLEWANKAIEARDAEVAASQRRLDLAAAQVDRARLRALQQADVPAAAKYDERGFEARVSEARGRAAEAQKEARGRDAQAATAHHAYQAALQQLEARTGAPGGRDRSGTGSSTPTEGSR